MPDTRILPFTMFSIRAPIPRAPPYLTMHTRSPAEHVRDLLPRSLQGTQGIIRMIAAFLGTDCRWVSVVGDLDRLYANRGQDLYFLFWVCSHRRPLPETLESLQSPWYRCAENPTTMRRLTVPDKGSQMLPIGQHGLYYTRTGHLGTSAELSPLIRLVSARGYVTTVQPGVPTGGRHLVVTERPGHWRHHQNTNPGLLLLRADQVLTLDAHLPWDSVILDHWRPTTNSLVSRYPDTRHLSGSLAPDWIRLDRALRMRRTTIVYVDRYSPSSILELCEYIFILQTRYHGELFLGPSFCRPYVSVLRVTETMLLEGILF